MIKLFFNKYQDPIEFRNDELIMCEASNRANPFIHEVHALEGRPTFREMFEYINHHSEPGDICIICNSDIFMDETLEAIYEIQPDEVFALSRYDMQEDGSLVLFDREDSQDCWLWVAPLKEIPDCDFTLGVPGCLSGDTTVYYNRGKRSSTRPIKLSHFYKAFKKHNKTFKKPDIPTFMRSVNCENSTMVYNEVLDVIESGLKATIKINFDNGGSLVCTPDHPIMRIDNSFTRADRLMVGDSVLGKGSGLCVKFSDKRKKSYRKEVYVRHHPTAPKMRIKRFEYPKTRRSRLVVEAHMNGLSYDEYVHILNTDEERSKGFSVLSPDQEVHHIDEDKTNDTIENLEVLSLHEHLKQPNHSVSDRALVDLFKCLKVVSIEENGLEMTYDIVMKSPHHNFIANGVFVHNCDNAIAERFARCGYTVKNPSLTIRTIHLHLSGVRRHGWKNPCPRPYLTVPPTEIYD